MKAKSAQRKLQVPSATPGGNHSSVNMRKIANIQIQDVDMSQMHNDSIQSLQNPKDPPMPPKHKQPSEKVGNGRHDEEARGARK